MTRRMPTVIAAVEWLGIWEDVLSSGGSVESAMHAAYTYLKYKYSSGNNAAILRVAPIDKDTLEDIVSWIIDAHTAYPEQGRARLADIMTHDLFSDAGCDYVEIFYAAEKKLDIIHSEEWFSIWESVFLAGGSAEDAMDAVHTDLKNKYARSNEAAILYVASLGAEHLPEIKEWLTAVYAVSPEVVENLNSAEELVNSVIAYDMFRAGGDIVELSYAA
jgi:hypothetical protein